MSKKAYRTTWNGTHSIVAAVTPGQARAVTIRSIEEVYDRRVAAKAWKEIRCVRAPEHDAWAEVDESRVGWDERYLPKVEGVK